MTAKLECETMCPDVAAAALAELRPGDALETSVGIRARRRLSGDYELTSPSHDPMTTMLLTTAARYLAAAHRLVERQLIAA